MKNLVNYLDEFIDENEICEEVIKSKKDFNKDAMKAFKKGSREEEIEMHGRPISYNKTFRNKNKYNRKDKHKNKYE